MDRFIPPDLVLCAQQIVLSTLYLEYCALQLGIQLWNFQYRQSLALADSVSDIHVDLHHEAGHFWMNIHHLVRLKLPGKTQGVRNVSLGSHGHLSRWDLGGSCIRMSIHDNVHNDADQNRKRDCRGDDQGGSFLHSSNAPLYEVRIAWFMATGHVLRWRIGLVAPDQ